MKYFAAFLKMQDVDKNRDLRPQHLAFLDANAANIYARGPFKDGAGGLVIYTAETLEEAATLAGKDPYVLQGARSLEIHEWDAKMKQ